MRGQSLRNLYESLGPVGFVKKIEEVVFKKRMVAPDQISLKELAEATMGSDWSERWNPRNLMMAEAQGGELMWKYTAHDEGPVGRDVMEAGDAIDVSAFAHITGQLFFNRILKGWMNAVMIGEKLTQNFPTKLDGEKIPWIGHAVSEGEDIGPGQQYPENSFGERYVTTPATKKQGSIISLTKEAIFFDLTGQMLKGGEELGTRLGYNKEKQILRTVMGIDNSYTLNDTTANTYQTVAGATPNTYINAQVSTPLVDWTSIQQYYTLSSQVLDPDTGNPIVTRPKMILVMPAKAMQARRIVAATQVRSTSPSFQGSPASDGPGNVQTIGDNPLPDQLEILVSSIAYQLLTVVQGLTATQANDYWWMGDMPECFIWAENWPMTIQQAPANNIKDFEQDIMMRWKASFRGRAAVLEPRYCFQFSNT